MDKKLFLKLLLPPRSFSPSAMLALSTHLDIRIQVSTRLSISGFKIRLNDRDKLSEFLETIRGYEQKLFVVRTELSWHRSDATALWGLLTGMRSLPLIRRTRKEGG